MSYIDFKEITKIYKMGEVEINALNKASFEIEKARFIYDIKAISYIYASALSILFTVIVNVITHFNLKKIDMIESLKSVE